MAKEEFELRAREQRFADEYISNGRNATQAYKKIQPNAKDTTCASNGSRLLRNAKVAQYIAEKTRERLNASNLTAQDVIDELIAIGFARPQKGVSKQFDRLTDEYILDIEYENTAKYEERLKALELLGKNMTMWTDKQENTTQATINIVDAWIDEDD